MGITETLHEIAKFHYILSEGRKGNHLLFSPEMIRGAFEVDRDVLRQLFQDKLEEINTALSQTFGLQSFEAKRDYIRTLSPEIQHAMIFGYFELIEGAESADSKVVH